MEEEGRVHPDCRNASNPYHECNDFCFKIIAEVKKKMVDADAGKLLNTLVTVSSRLFWLRLIEGLIEEILSLCGLRFTNIDVQFADAC